MNILSIKKLFNILLIILFLVGSFTSLNVGISHDEWHEEQNWKFNLEVTKAAKNKILFDEKSDFEIDANLDKYYGIGFQLISQPIQFFLKKKVKEHQNVNDFGAKLISKHFVVFLFFFISGICFFKIIKKIVSNVTIAYFSTFLYLLYPYLFGHSLFSPKDIPFLAVWLICTYISFTIFEKLLKNKDLSLKKILFFGLFTSYLLSIRVTGVLIFFQYLITLLIFINVTDFKIIDFTKKFYKKILYFFSFLFVGIIILNPVYWSNPLSFYHAIKWMSHYYHDICTITLGTCMRAKDLPSTYMLIWLSVKLPIIIMLGIILIPFTERKIFKDKKKTIIFGSLLGTIIFIPLLLIFINVNLYDEIRHVMFLIPLIFILGLSSLFYFSKKIFYVLSFITIIIFISENIRIHPYQYVWFNLPSRALDLTKKFELEYMGISGKEISKQILSSNEDSLCVLSSPGHTVEPYFHKSKYDCFDRWQLIDTNYKRPFLAVQHVRNIKKGLPYNCKILSESSFKLLFHKEKFITGKLLKCF